MGRSEDRAAIVLRFFEQRDFRSVGEELGSSEDAARMRVNRARQKLRLLLKRRGLALSTATLGTALASEAIRAAPAALAASIASAALASGPAGAGVASTILKLLTMTKIQISGFGDTPCAKSNCYPGTGIVDGTRGSW
ncbi:MAG: sigma factor-like helix-turn-helix DNA-binding protein [Limisphaerales bacterium]